MKPLLACLLLVSSLCSGAAHATEDPSSKANNAFEALNETGKHAAAAFSGLQRPSAAFSGLTAEAGKPR